MAESPEDPASVLADPDIQRVRAELARLFIAHKADLGLADTVPDRWIVDHVDTLMYSMMKVTTAAKRAGAAHLLAEYEWFLAPCRSMLAGERAPSLDG